MTGRANSAIHVDTNKQEKNFLLESMKMYVSKNRRYSKGDAILASINFWEKERELGLLVSIIFFGHFFHFYHQVIFDSMKR